MPGQRHPYPIGLDGDVCWAVEGPGLSIKLHVGCQPLVAQIQQAQRRQPLIGGPSPADWLLRDSPTAPAPASSSLMVAPTAMVAAGRGDTSKESPQPGEPEYKCPPKKINTLSTHTIGRGASVQLQARQVHSMQPGNLVILVSLGPVRCQDGEARRLGGR